MCSGHLPAPHTRCEQSINDWGSSGLVVWSIPSQALLPHLPCQAYEGVGLRPGQLCSSIPGTQSICKKKKLSETLKQAYGDDAFRIIPRWLCTSVQEETWGHLFPTLLRKSDLALYIGSYDSHLGFVTPLVWGMDLSFVNQLGLGSAALLPGRTHYQARSGTGGNG